MVRFGFSTVLFEGFDDTESDALVLQQEIPKNLIND